MVRTRALALAAPALFGVACHQGGVLPAPVTPNARSPETLVLDLGGRAAADLSALLAPAEGASRYALLGDGDARVLRVLEGDGPREIRLVDSGGLSQLALLEAGQIDGADLDDAEVAVHASAPGGAELHVFRDFERIVLRLSPRLLPLEREALWRAAGREALAEILFPRTGRPAAACLPGREGPEPAPAAEVLPREPVVLLARSDREDLGRVARRVAASWGAAVGVRARVERVPPAVVRDRLISGRFDAAVLSIGRRTDSEPAEAAFEDWICPAPLPAGEEDPEEWLREACGLFPLVSLDRVVAVRPGLEGVVFDERGRVLWHGVSEVR